MELGIGFIVGALAGCILAGIVLLVVIVSRRVAGISRKNDETRAAAALPVRPATNSNGDSQGKGNGNGTTAGRTTGIRPRPATAVMPSSGRVTERRSDTARKSRSTVFIDRMESNEGLLNKNIQEVRDLIFRLAEVISTTDAASGKAAEAFNSVRAAIDTIDIDKADDLIDAQKVLVRGIDRVLRTNATLQKQLDRANQGIEEQRRQIEELRVAARVDSLTNLPNRAAFDERMNEFIALLDRTSMLFSFLLIDIDHFKAVNDEYGHPNGDRVLRGVATKISENIRTNDFAARYGGEEFAVILPATELDEAEKVAERMRQDIARTNFRLDDKVIHITVSGGLVQAHKGTSSEEVVRTADGALYESKHGGRNQITAVGHAGM